MKNIFKYSLALLTVILGFASCDSEKDENYQAASISGSQVFFANGLQTKYEISPDANSFAVTISRGAAAGALSVPLKVTQSEGSIFTVPSTVNFADGEKDASIVISYDPAQIVYGDYATIKIEVDDAAMTTPYGLSSYQFSAGVTAWVDYGKGYYREDIISTWYSLGHPVYDVTIQKNTVKEGLYRIVNPYGATYANAIAEALGGDDWADYYDYDNDYYMEIDASNPNAVYVLESKTGAIIDPASGNISFSSIVAYYLSKGQSLADVQAQHPEYFGTLKDGIITMPAGSMLISEENYNDGAWSTAARNGLFAVALPGSVIADYSLDVAYVGRYTSAENVDYARLEFTFGPDVESVKYALVAPDGDVDATAVGIQNGSVEAAEISASGTAEVTYGASGKYTLVAVVYAGGEAVGVETFTFKLQSSGDTAETWTAIFIGDYTYGAQNYSTGSVLFGETVTDNDLTLYQSDSNPSRYRIAPLWNENEVGLVFEMDDNDVITVDGVETGLVSSEGMIYATDFVTGELANMPSYYEEGVFYFNLAYHLEGDTQAGFAFEQDTFTLTAQAQAAMKKAAKKFTVKKAAKRSSKRSAAKKAVAKKIITKQHIMKLQREKASLR